MYSKNSLMTKEYRNFMEIIRPLTNSKCHTTETAIVEVTQRKFYNSITHLNSDLINEVTSNEVFLERIGSTPEKDEYNGCRFLMAKCFTAQLDNNEHKLFAKGQGLGARSKVFYNVLNSILLKREYYYVRELPIDQLKEMVKASYPDFIFKKSERARKIIGEDAACSFKAYNDAVGEDIITTARVDRAHHELLIGDIPMIGKYTRGSDPVYEITDKNNPVIYGSVSALIREAYMEAGVTNFPRHQLNNLVRWAKIKIARFGEIQIQEKVTSPYPVNKINQVFAGRKFVLFDTVSVEEIETNEKNRVNNIATKKLEAYENIFAQFLPLVTQMSEALANMSKQLEELKK